MSVFNGNQRNGFTLIELLVVVAIIALLALLLFPLIGKARENAMRTVARRQIGHLEVAFKGYLEEYRKPHGNIVGYGNWPAADKDVEGVINGIQLEDEVVRMLGGENLLGSNRKQIPFYQSADIDLNGSGQFVDPWGQPYKYMLDYNRDGKVTVNFTSFDGVTNLFQEVAVWSRGKDADDQLSTGGWDDDVRNW